jgi:phosphate transport system substrate-binding protein
MGRRVSSWEAVFLSVSRRGLCCASLGRIRALAVNLCLGLLLLMPACTQTPTPTVEVVQFSVVADDSTAPLMRELVSVYLSDRPNVNIQLETAANSEKALQALRDGQAELASVSWLSGTEKVNGPLWHLPIARDSIVVITHPTNPVGGLTLQELRALYQGQILSWDELGGPAVSIMPVSREDGSGVRQSFESFVLGRRDVTPTAVVMPSNQAVVEYVAATPGAIGYISTAWLAPTVSLLAVEGVTPSQVSVKDGRYILARPYYLVALRAPEDGLAAFVGWIKEGTGSEIVSQDYALAP